MKNVKNLVAIMALVGVLGISSSYAANQTADGNGANQQYSQTAESWFDSLFNYVNGYLTNNQEIVRPQPEFNKLAANHNETLVLDEN